MTHNPDPMKAQTTRELLKLARRIERLAAWRRELVKRLTELEANLRANKRLLKGLADSIGAPLDPPALIARDELITDLCGNVVQPTDPDYDELKPRGSK